MLKWIRDARIDLRTGLVVIAIALAAWAVVIYANMRGYAAEETVRDRPSGLTADPRPVNDPP